MSRGDAISRRAASIITLLCSACVPSGQLKNEAAPVPVFDPIAFFIGHTHGTGSLSVVFHKRETTEVAGQGRADSDGSIVLEQTVRQGSKPATLRQWRLRRLAGGEYAGTLWDASSPVRGEVTGNRFHLAFAMRGGLRVNQWLYLQPGGRTAYNRMVVTKFGITVARLNETISRVQE